MFRFSGAAQISTPTSLPWSSLAPSTKALPHLAFMLTPVPMKLCSSRIGITGGGRGYGVFAGKSLAIIEVAPIGWTGLSHN